MPLPWTAYDTLILLYRVDHKVIDDQPQEYTRERLHQIEAEHEAYDVVLEALEPSAGRGGVVCFAQFVAVHSESMGEECRGIETLGYEHLRAPLCRSRTDL